MDITIDEKRVYADRTGAVEVLVAAEQGVVAASLSADRVGEFALDHRATARGVVADGSRRAVATAEDVLVGDYAPTDFGPAVAVGFDGPGGDLLAAGPDGRVARLGEEWTTVGHVEDPRAIDSGMVAAGDGVWMVEEGLRNVGLDDVRDAHGRGLPLAATGDGLYRLGNGWMDELDGAFAAVSVDAEDRRAHAVSEAGLFARETIGEWTPVDLPTDQPVDVGYTEAATVAVTATGTLLADAGDGWRTHELGVTGVAGLAVQS